MAANFQQIGFHFRNFKTIIVQIQVSEGNRNKRPYTTNILTIPYVDIRWDVCSYCVFQAGDTYEYCYLVIIIHRDNS